MIRAREIKRIPGMSKTGSGGKLYDYRGTGLLPPSGGRINPLVGVEHIPVIRQMAGVEDFIVLANVLRAQGLSLQVATDGEGNVCLYNSLNVLCWQARGANAVSYGVEHMHLTVGEEWTERQFRAAALVMVRAHFNVGIPLRGGRLLPGPGLVRVQARGHVSHKAVSQAAGFNDRSDPGDGFRFAHCYELAEHFIRRGTF
jgi:hypothetical protein